MKKKLEDIKFFLSYLKYAKLLFFASFVVTLIYVACVAYLPEIPSKVISTDVHQIPSLKLFLIQNGLILFAVVLVYGVSMYIRSLLFNALANKIATQMQMDLAGHLLSLKMKSFDEITAGNITSRFCSDVNKAREIYTPALPMIIDSVVMATVLYTRLAFLNPYICAVGLLYFPLIYFIGKSFLKKTAPHLKQAMNSKGEMSGFLNETIKSVESVVSFGQEENIAKRFDSYSRGVYEGYRKYLLVNGYFSWNIVVRVRHLVDIGLLLIFGILYFNGIKAGLSSLFIAFAYNNSIFHHFLSIVMQLSAIQRAFIAGGRVKEVIAFEHERKNGNEIDVKEGKVEFRNVKFEYNESVPVLKNISFSVDKGETVAFIGKTGCGKSTLMNLLLGFYEGYEGEILIDGQNIKTLSLASLRRDIAIVLQEPYLFEGSIFDNIGMGVKKITKEEAIKYLEAVGGKSIIDRDSNGIMQTVSENGKNFSHGERQIICFARALAFNPKVLILDEATSNIDVETERLITRGIEVLKKGRTTLIIAHRLETIKNVDIVYHIKDGIIVEKGKFEDIKEYELN
jgi:ABC-type multidrug transport system, ATPase and permease components